MSSDEKKPFWRKLFAGGDKGPLDNEKIQTPAQSQSEPPDHSRMIEVERLRQEARLARSMGDLEKCPVLLEQAVDLMKGDERFVQREVVYHLEILAESYCLVGQFEKAAQAFEQIESLEPDNPSLTFSQAVVYAASGELDKFERIREKDIHKSIPALTKASAGFVRDVAEICEQNGRYREAELLYQLDIDVTSAHWAPHHPLVAKSLIDMGRTQFLAENYLSAVDSFQRAVSILEGTKGDDSTELISPLHAMAQIYCDYLDRLDQGEAVLRRAIAVQTKQSGRNHADSMLTIRTLADVLAKSGKPDEAEALYKEEIAFFEKKEGPDSTEIADSSIRLARICLEKDCNSEAEDYCRRALTIRLKNLDENDIEIAACCHFLSASLVGQGKYAEAIDAVKQEVSILEHNFGSDDPSVAGALNKIAKVKIAQGDVPEAVLVLKRISSILEKCFGPDAPQVQAVREQLKELSSANDE